LPDLLYLDTARLGRMSPTARHAHRDFVEMAGEEGASLHFERFLRSGFDAFPQEAHSRYPGLATWRGMGSFAQSLRTLAGSRPDLPVLVANRSAQLMKFAARLLCHPCRRVLATDLSWPGYQAVLERECLRANRSVATVPVCRDILERRADEDEVVERVCATFARERCDGLFLTAVSHLGVRLPVERIVRRLEAAHEVWFVVIDGAQDFCHASADLRSEYCDLYLASCHKWLGAYHPMGLGFYGRRRSRGVIETVLSHLTAAGDLDDPLLRFAAQLEADALDGTSETVNLTSLFSCQGAVADALAPGQAANGLPIRLQNAGELTGMVQAAGWRPLLPAESLRTGILLLQAERGATRKKPGQDLRAAFCEQGVALTAYEDGLVRLSMPNCGWRAGEINHLHDALRSIA
jgi:hypothetical protein